MFQDIGTVPCVTVYIFTYFDHLVEVYLLFSQLIKNNRNCSMKLSLDLQLIQCSLQWNSPGGSHSFSIKAKAAASQI